MISTSWWIYLLVLILSHLYEVQSADICYRGHKLYSPSRGGPDVCLPCQYGQFIPEEKHSLRQCYQCTKIENPQLEILVHHCNITHDTEIHCIDGYYRTRPSYPHDRGHCNKCTQCLFPKRRCQTFEDTVCCSGDDYGVYINKGGHAECVRECGPGQFFNSDNDQCLPCPQTTYMDEHKHINDYCKNCPIPTSPKEKIIRPCNATNPTVIGCVDGYSREFNNIKVTNHTECIKVCGRGEFVERETDTCLPCHEKTYMDEDRHSHIDKCKPCEVLKSKNDLILQACNSTHPAVIGCRDGFYRRLSQDLSSSICAPCRDCSENVYVGRACGLSENTICCSQPDMDVMDTLGGPVCVFLNRAVLCGEGEYLSTNASAHSLTCQPCPQGTYMDQTKHSKTSCKSCEEFPRVKFCSDDDESHSNAAIVGVAICVMILTLLGLCGLLINWRKLNRMSAEHKDRHSEVRRNSCGRKKQQSDLFGNLDGFEMSRIKRERKYAHPVQESEHGTEESTNDEALLPKFSETAGSDVESKSTNHRSSGGNDVLASLPERSESGQACNSTSETGQVFRPVDAVVKHTTKMIGFRPSPSGPQPSVQELEPDINLVVYLQVEDSSPRRPEFFPGTNEPYLCSGAIYRTMKRKGRGQVYSVKIYNGQPCVCESCQRSPVPEMSWGEIVILTETTVVFDLTEGRKTSCCRYNSNVIDDKKLIPSRFKLYGAVKVSSDINNNKSYVTFVTHDISLLKQFF